MDSESEKPLRLFVNPFTIWTQLALKTQEAMWASAHAAAVRANSTRVAVIPTVDAPAPEAQAPAEQHAATPRQAKAPVRQASKAARFKATRRKLRSKGSANRRGRR